ncbi:MAG TPA: phosphate ABC transporter permease [Blastocatellia bacterium]|nr:phosphate ABC transporter permease [Blastocatellia bacterium]HAF21648.1 phosphate ABC transporter permease [Blastocatellia bacterium]
MPSHPLAIIEPTKGLVSLNLVELWTYRELLYFLTWRDVKVRYKQTVLGAAWAILQPLFMMIIFSLFFGRLAGVDSKGVPYPLFALAGLVPWTFFANAVTSSGNSLVGSANLITKVYFPRVLVPAAAVVAGLVDFIIAFLTLVGAMLYYKVGLTLNILMLPMLVMLTTLFALAVGMWMSALNVKYRDVRFALPFVIQIWLFVSSVIVPSTALPQKWRWLLSLNPMSAIVESYRAALFGLPFNWQTLGIATVITLAVLTYSAYSFHRVEKTFADII